MKNLFGMKTRYLLPRWVPSSAMAKTLFGKPNFLPLKDHVDLNLLVKTIEDWKFYKTNLFAREVVTISKLLDFRSEDVIEAEDFLYKNNQTLAINIHSKLVDHENFFSINEIIKKSRAKLNVIPEDPFSNLDMAFCYTVLRDIDKARRYMSIALKYGSENIFIMRSVVRFLLHVEDDSEIALFHLRKLLNIKQFPSLIAPEIAISECLGVKPRFLRKGSLLLKKNDPKSWSMSELHSVFSTLDIRNGYFKSAKTNAQKALISPNENSLAQVVTLFEFEFKESLLSFEEMNAHETQAIISYLNGDFKNSEIYCNQWKKFQPFSSKPYLFLSGIYYFSQLQPGKAVNELLNCINKLGEDFTLINNLVFYLIKNNELDSALKYLEILKSKLLSPGEKAIYQATLGLFLMKVGEVLIGEELYENSFHLFRQMKNFHMEIRAKYFFLEEKLKLDVDQFIKEISHLLKTTYFFEQPDLVYYVKNKIIEISRWDEVSHFFVGHKYISNSHIDITPETL